MWVTVVPYTHYLNPYNNPKKLELFFYYPILQVRKWRPQRNHTMVELKPRQASLEVWVLACISPLGQTFPPCSPFPGKLSEGTRKVSAFDVTFLGQKSVGRGSPKSQRLGPIPPPAPFPNDLEAGKGTSSHPEEDSF